MAPAKSDNARKRRRKARTEVSSSPSDSSSESEKSFPSPPNDQNRSIDEPRSASSSQSPDETPKQSPRASSPKQTLKSSEQAFEDFYLKQATKEFANDIDKLRSAPDFNERNVPILIRALRQGTACFGEAERRRIGGGVRFVGVGT